MTAQSIETAAFFIDSQWELMGATLNRIIPSSGAFPGAGDLGVARYIDRVIGQAAELKRLFVQGMTQIDITSQEQYAQAFTSLSEQQQDGVLRQVESSHRKFFSALVTHAYSGYYSDPVILRLLGLEARPPQPRGHELEPLDLGLLEHVKQRAPLYKPV
jgi:Gluconate 2-dehydrogenase subunit 3